MSLFQCENCGCCENTALASQGFGILPDCFDWSAMGDKRGKKLCSACGPTKYADGKSTKYGKWHGVFEQVFLPMGLFKTARNGNLEHVKTGEQDYFKYAINKL